jgi:hypothetical protein
MLVGVVNEWYLCCFMSMSGAHAAFGLSIMGVAAR